MDEMEIRKKLVEEMKTEVLNSFSLDEFDDKQLKEQIHTYVFLL